MMPKDILNKFPDINLFKGYSKILDFCQPDYTIDWGIKQKFDSFSYVFTTRGCPNKCAYCVVWKIEDNWINPTWKSHIDKDKPNVMVYDNNLSSQPIEHVESVIKFLVDEKKGVCFDNGFDCKYIDKHIAEMLSGIRFVRNGMRLAFDRIDDDVVFQKAVETLLSAGIPKSAFMAYVLFNFTDTPKEANYRATECVRLGIHPYPQQYVPLNKKNRDNPYIGKLWTRNLVRAFRFFWLMAGYFTKTDFETWVKSQDKYKLNDEDWEKWNK
ncbi:hypothetical protein LCGC14_1720160 [marine sediment metagenome]|uniref:Radical SAM core domain-containing protein n=1 Tax=marine sediment metagenome TaxID=412755 RepID=A0A0F9JT50_9ZZZZ